MKHQGNSSWEQFENEKRNQYSHSQNEGYFDWNQHNERIKGKKETEIRVHEKVYEERKINERIVLGSYDTSYSSTDSYNTKKTTVDTPVENKVESIEQPRLDIICLLETPFDDFFPAPFYVYVDFIVSTNYYSNRSIHFTAKLKDSAKLFFQGLINKKPEDKNEPEHLFENIFSNRADYTVEVTLYPSGYRIYSISGKDYFCSLRYDDQKNEIDVRLNAENILSSKATLKEAITNGRVCPYCLALTNESAQFPVCSCNIKDSASMHIQWQSPIYFILSEDDRFHIRTAQERDRLFRLRSEGLQLIDSLSKGENKLFENEIAAYTWLAKIMELPLDETHFGVFSAEQVLCAIRKLKRHKWKQKWFSYFFGIFTKQKYE